MTVFLVCYALGLAHAALHARMNDGRISLKDFAACLVIGPVFWVSTLFWTVIGVVVDVFDFDRDSSELSHIFIND